MRAMLLERIGEIHAGTEPLRLVALPDPAPGNNEVLLQVLTCGVCHTELDEIEGRTPPPTLPIVPGHQVVGRVIGLGAKASPQLLGQRVGVAWIGGACGECEDCQIGRENLCRNFVATGRDRHGGYAERMTALADFVHPLSDSLTDIEVAPLLCAGAIGYRSLTLTHLHDGERLGLTGFGASGRLVLWLMKAVFPHSTVSVFARSADEREAALKLGAEWAGETTERPPSLFDAIIDTTPAWTPVVAALASLKPGGRLVINAIRKEPRDLSALLTLSYEHHLWMEKEIKSVANVTRRDVAEVLRIAAGKKLQLPVDEYRLEDANAALIELRTKPVLAAKVLRVSH
ncbi:alcohol dehydrogenase [Planctomyces sp. SCGC AG-212-M04]|nr:alcohol dehydrogenase [Planctomyces sp. SCGC AG-212-M04]